ncbi:MAG: protein translocase subunit SecF [Candidatus Magasanikbacteria bacterium]|nr:protein translocase subunit SecF [Candidatus Magasanikbacteria bacterium]
MNLPFIKYSKVWLGIALTVSVVAASFIAVWGLKPGIDFTGGSLMELEFKTERPAPELVVKSFEELGINNTSIQKSENLSLIIRTSFLQEEKHQEVLNKIKELSGNNEFIEQRFETIGASVSNQLRQRALWAIIFVSIGIILYVAYAFRKVSQPVRSWKYGAMALVAVLHDLLLVMGIFAILGHFTGIEVDVAFVVALLTVLGYSINDTIVVYDRIRENLIHRGNRSFSEVVNDGLNQTLFRSINTTLTTLLPLLALFFFGGATIHNFVLALIIGVASGAYSSIFIAAPLLAVVENFQRTRKI